MPHASSPFILVYDRNWELIENNAALAELVKPANRIKFGTVESMAKRLIEKPERMAADYPQLGIAPIASENQPAISSGRARFMHTLELVIITGEQQLGSLYDVEYELLRSISRWRTIIVAEHPSTEGLYWGSQNKRLVYNFSYGPGPMTMVDDELNKGIIGWAKRWQLNLDMQFNFPELENDGA